MKRLKSVLFVLWVVLVLQTAPAYSQGVSVDQAARKLGRGLVNVVTGWAEIPVQLGTGMSETESIEGFFLGFGKGLVWTILRTGAGVYETVTFFIPLPANYAPLMDPPTLFE